MAIVDGDTIRAHGRTYRLVGFDAPETMNAKCTAERELGERAARRLKEIADLGGLDLTEVTCSCLPGIRGTRFCNHGRLCGALTARGEDVGLNSYAKGSPIRFIAASTAARNGKAGVRPTIFVMGELSI
jgi:endonuclease YncB( thermonuclease family)